MVVQVEGQVWKAQPRQAEFLLAEEDEVLYGGAAFGGKTDALLIDAINLCMDHPGAKAMYVRRTYHDMSLPGAAIPRSKELLWGKAKWDPETFTWTFPTKPMLSTLTFGHLENVADMYQYQGAQLDGLYMDEITQFEEIQYGFMRSRVRATVEGVKPRIRLATNPGGVGHGWVKKRFVDAAPWGVPYWIKDEGGKVVGSACFIPAKAADNKIGLGRDPGYMRRMDGLPDALRRAYRDGDWDVFEGQVLAEWDRKVHVCEPFPIPKEWARWRGVDYGYSAEMAALWLAQDPRGGVYVYREMYERMRTDAEQAQAILRMSKGEWVWYTVGDPSMWNKQPNGSSIAEVYAGNGVPMYPGNNDRLAGLARLHEYLKHEGREPRLRIFSTCVNLIRTLPGLVYSKYRVEDVDSKAEDHLYDALRYGLMMAAVNMQQRPRESYSFAPLGQGA